METIALYEKVFEDIVRCRNIDNIETAKSLDRKPEKELTDREIYNITSTLIYKSEDMWETIYDNIDFLIWEELKHRENIGTDDEKKNGGDKNVDIQ